MKNILLVLFALCSFLIGNSQQKSDFIKAKKIYSYTPDGKVEYEISKKKILVKFKDGLSFVQKASIVKKYELLNSLTEAMLLPSPKVALLEIKNASINEDAILKLIDQLNHEMNIEYANIFLVYKDGSLQGITNRFYVKLNSQTDIVTLQDEAKKYHFEIKQQYEYDSKLYFIEVNKQSLGNALELANKMSETKKFAAAEPDFLLLLKKMVPNDTYINYQWSLNNTGSSIQYSGTPGADMNVYNAWNITTGNASTKVAVIDEGVDLVHPDLVGNMLAGFDGTGLGSAGAPSGDDAHGTNCAGIIAAVGNNSLGVAGVAYSSKIVPIRIAYGSGSSWVTSNAWIGTCIDWAWDQGDADVLSNSWGGGSSSTLINDAVGRATTLGRGGLGSPVLFAAGNDNGPVSYPATLTNVISVTAMSMCNQRKSTTSCDGETFWGSNYGTGTDVSAPGVKIYSTDISGANGYSTGDYYATFNGTSSATPNTSGVMALILAVNPALTMAQARQILETTCDKVGGYTYTAGVSGQPNGTWSNDLGYGRVNAYAAVQLANPSPCVNPPAVATTNASPSTICSPTPVSLSLSGILFGTGQTYQWQSSPNNTTYTNISGATSSAYNATVSTGTWFRCAVTCGATTNSTPVQVVYNNPTIITYPHSENFDATNSIPCGWSVVDANSDGYTWSSQTLNARSTPNTITYSYNVSSAANDWLFSPPLSMIAGNSYQVKFWYRVRSATYPEKLEVKWGSTATAAGMTSTAIFSNTNLTNTTYLQATTTTITPTTTGNYYVGFRVFSNADEYDLNIDDVTFEALCTTPSVTISQTTGTNPTCVGSSVTFNATGTNVGTTPSYQWKLNGSNVGTNSATYSSSTITTGQVVTCVVTSSAPCNTTPTATSNAITMTVNPIVTPSVSIAITTGTNPSCAGASITFTATPLNGGTAPSYQWKVNGANVGTNSSTYTTASLTSGQIVTCVLTTNATCASTPTSTSNAITITLNPTVIPTISIALTSGSNPSCAGLSKTFTASITNGGTSPSYQWKVNGANVGTNSATYTTTSLTNGQIVTCVLTSNATCASSTSITSNSITITINPTVVPSVSIALTSGTNPSCAGTSKTFTASPTNGGTSPSYQWKVNGSNVGTNSTTYTSSTLTNTQSVTCVMTSNANCASTTTATSNAIVMTINSASANTPQTVSACNSYTWSANGLTYTTSGVKTASFTNAAGCDSTRTLNLTIKQSSSSTSTITATGSYVWNANGTTYTSTGTYSHTLLNSVGCDSVLTLNLTINLAMGVVISPKVLLAGPYSTTTGLMIDSLRTNGLIPSTEPYSLPPLNYPQVGYSGGETVSPAILSITGNNAIVDWVYLELRSASNPSSIIATKRALVQRDGDVVSSTDGVSPISFPSQLWGNYYVSIKHRNHLGVMTATALSLNGTSTSINFTTTSPVWVHPSITNNPPRKASGSVMLLYCGDASANKNVKYNGASNDKDAVLNAVGVATPNNVLIGYRTEDVNLDSKVKYNNTESDRATILNSVGANTPNLILFQHTPN